VNVQPNIVDPTIGHAGASHHRTHARQYGGVSIALHWCLAIELHRIGEPRKRHRRPDIGNPIAIHLRVARPHAHGAESDQWRFEECSRRVPRHRPRACFGSVVILASRLGPHGERESSPPLHFRNVDRIGSARNPKSNQSRSPHHCFGTRATRSGTLPPLPHSPTAQTASGGRSHCRSADSIGLQ
jgi:hypothetical protein